MKTKSERRIKLEEAYRSNKMSGFHLLMDNVWDPHNVAAVSRTADGLGVSRIYLYYTYNQAFNPRQVGSSSSSSANRWLEYEKIQSLPEFANSKSAEGWTFVGAEWGPEAENLLDFVWPEKTILVMGSESKGISEEIRHLCQKKVFVPMVGMVQSYNISVAAALLMYEVFRQRGRHLNLMVDPELRGVRN